MNPTHDDGPTRDAIATDLDATLFVDAGAGSGKTSSLVGRVVNLATADDGQRVPLSRIAAITFTEKAASELRDRIRIELERRAAAAGAAGDPRAYQRAREALDDVDAAAISTLHSFAQRIVTEFPIEAGLPPDVQVVDEIGASIVFADRWTAFVDQLLDDPAVEVPLLCSLAAGVSLDHLRSVARVCNANWDLLLGYRSPPPRPGIDAAARGLGAELLEVSGQRVACRDPGDRLARLLAEVEVWARALRDAPDEIELVRLLGDAPKLDGKAGNQRNWPGGEVLVIRDRLATLGVRASSLFAQAVGAALEQLLDRIVHFTLDAADERARSGRLEFHDLLVRALLLVRDPAIGPDVCRRLADKYERLLIDEFQDTDPIQLELAVRLAAAEPASGGDDWDGIRVTPGRLFVVGDPKQSIYRFRRADIRQYLAARRRLVAAPLALTRNFRTVAPIIDWVNHVFGKLIEFSEGSQPEYLPLVAARDPAPAGPAVTLLGAEAHDDGPKAAELRAREGADAAAAIRTAIVDRWPVSERAADGSEAWRDARLGDVCVLIPTRTSLDALEDALAEAGIPYRAETSSLVYATREVRDLLATLRAVADPTDELALVTALRSSVFGCGDDDLYSWRHVHRGRWNLRAPVPDGVPDGHPVRVGVEYLAARARERWWYTPSELLERVVRDRRVMEIAFATGRPRDVWRRMRFVVDQARAWQEAGGGSLRDYVAWAAQQATDEARVVETVLPETDDDSVRILTVHGAKGLEFPICVVSGTTVPARATNRGARVVFGPDGRPAVRIREGLETPDFGGVAQVDDERDRHERLRLAYVACTRARDHLVVSVHRVAGGDVPGTYAEVLWSACAGAPGQQPLVAADGHLPAPAVIPAAALVDRTAWAEERAGALRDASRSRVVAATTLAKQAPAPSPEEVDPALAKDAPDPEAPPWRKGRGGTRLGRAVHAVLQTVDLRSGAGVEDAAEAQAVAEGLAGRGAEIAALARAALASPVVREAAGASFRRELYVAAPVEDIVLEGYVDLVFRGPDGLVVVDYKTDALSEGAEWAARFDRYRLQGAAYAVALEHVTRERVARCVFVQVGVDGALEHQVTDLDAARRDVLALARTPADQAVP